jgi:hypothetical protein
MNQKIYRQEALDRLSSPEQFDQLMPVTSPRGWIALAGAGLLLVVASLWAVLGTITVTVDGPGIFVRQGGVYSVTAADTGRVNTVEVRVGDEVRAGQALFHLDSSQPGGQQKVVSPREGRVLGINVRKYDSVEKGATLLTLEPLNVPLEAVLFIPATEGYQVNPGDPARVAAGGKGEQGGRLRGRVRRASRYPADRATLLRILRNEGLADQVSRSGPCLIVVVELDEPLDETGLYSGAPCHAHIVVATKRPISLVLPLGLVMGFDHG